MALEGIILCLYVLFGDRGVFLGGSSLRLYSSLFCVCILFFESRSMSGVGLGAMGCRGEFVGSLYLC